LDNTRVHLNITQKRRNGGKRARERARASERASELLPESKEEEMRGKARE